MQGSARPVERQGKGIAFQSHTFVDHLTFRVSHLVRIGAVFALCVEDQARALGLHGIERFTDHHQRRRSIAIVVRHGQIVLPP
ncbi:hypothetical protein ABE85_09180 [Mitsuaria sp. 7]|nr:hypothetical protein ABE85_09180 [Mitsuaria sp. 7]